MTTESLAERCVRAMWALHRTDRYVARLMNQPNDLAGLLEIGEAIAAGRRRSAVAKRILAHAVADCLEQK